MSRYVPKHRAEHEIYLISGLVDKAVEFFDGDAPLASDGIAFQYPPSSRQIAARDGMAFGPTERKKARLSASIAAALVIASGIGVGFGSAVAGPYSTHYSETK